MDLACGQIVSPLKLIFRFHFFPFAPLCICTRRLRLVYSLGMKSFLRPVAAMLFAAWLADSGAARGDAVPPAGTNLWLLKLPAFGSGSAPALAPDGSIYLGLFDGTFLAVTPQGRVKWKFKTRREIKSSPAIAGDGSIYFGSRDRNFYAVTPAGKLKWVFPTGAWVDSSPAIAADGTVYFGSWDKNFYALNPDGTLKWKLAVGAIVDSSPAIAADGTIYFGAHDKVFYALKPDGAVRWKFPTGGGIISSPALGAGGVIYFSSLDGNLYALNPDGAERWRCHLGGTTGSSPVVAADGTIAIGQNSLMAVVSPAGKKLWHSGSALPEEVSAVAVADRFYFYLAWRTISAVAPADQRLWQAELLHNVTASPTLGPDGIVLVNAEMDLQAIQPPDKTRPATNSPWPMFRANARHTGRVEK